MESLLAQANKKLRVMKRYIVHSILIGFVLGWVSAFWIGLFMGFQFTDVLSMWIGWSLVLSVVLPAMLNDEFSS